MTECLPGTDLLEVSAGSVTMRRLTRDDLDERCKWPPYDDVVFRHLNLALHTRDQRDRWYRREHSIRQPFWFAVDYENGKLLGSITLREVSRWKRQARLGIHIHPQLLGRGYGTRAMKLFLDYYFTMLKFKLLKLDVAAYNLRAIGCYDKLGFKRIHEFWKPNLSSLQWLQDERFNHVRDCVQIRRGMEKVQHLEMQMSASDYAEVTGTLPTEAQHNT